MYLKTLTFGMSLKTPMKKKSSYFLDTINFITIIIMINNSLIDLSYNKSKDVYMNV